MWMSGSLDRRASVRLHPRQRRMRKIGTKGRISFDTNPPRRAAGCGLGGCAEYPHAINPRDTIGTTVWEGTTDLIWPPLGVLLPRFEFRELWLCIVTQSLTLRYCSTLSLIHVLTFRGAVESDNTKQLTSASQIIILFHYFFRIIRIMKNNLKIKCTLLPLFVNILIIIHHCFSYHFWQLIIFFVLNILIIIFFESKYFNFLIMTGESFTSIPKQADSLACSAVPVWPCMALGSHKAG